MLCRNSIWFLKRASDYIHNGTVCIATRACLMNASVAENHLFYIFTDSRTHASSNKVKTKHHRFKLHSLFDILINFHIKLLLVILSMTLVFLILYVISDLASDTNIFKRHPQQFVFLDWYTDVLMKQSVIDYKKTTCQMNKHT